MNRVALVTGGAQGIGEGICRALAGKGRAVVVADLNLAGAETTVAAIRDVGGSAVAVQIDVTSRQSVESGLQRAEDALGGVDILVNNVGWDQLMPFTQTDEALWDRILDLNFKGALRMIQAVLPRMIDQQWGRIVNIGSDAGRVGSSLESVYSGAKGGVISFTKTLARETARKGITANCVCPGPTDTPSLRETLAEQGDSESVLEKMIRGVPMRRAAQPSDIGAAVSFFASDEAGYITGQTLSVSGGLTMV